jgi:DNA-binding NtrC family response regulator
VLVTGESGTGKELVAKSIHGSSPRKGRPFVPLNCATIPDTLLDSELFGHKRGAFTDARSDRAGLFVEADGGTLFLDEIAELSPALQAKLLRVLQEGEIRPLGASRAERVDVRVIAATNKDLDARLKTGAFREDLYYRLNVVHIHLPPLRERAEDLLALSEHFLSASAARAGKEVRGLHESAKKALLSHTWPGNIRELENVLSRAAILCDGETIRSHDLAMLGLDAGSVGRDKADDDRVEVEPIDLDRLGDGETLKDVTDRATRAVERAAITAALRRDRTPAAAARRLGISRASIYTKMKTYGLGGDGQEGA